MLREPQQSSSVSEVSEVIIDVPCIWRCFLPQPYFKGRKKISQIPNPPEKQVTKPVNQGNHRHINTALLHTRHHHAHSRSGATPPSLYGIDLYYFARKALLLHEASSTGAHHPPLLLASPISSGHALPSKPNAHRPVAEALPQRDYTSLLQ